MLPEEFELEYRRCRDLIETRLQRHFAGGFEGGLEESMRYSLLAGGKRIRPVMVLAFAAAAGGNRLPSDQSTAEKALPAAAAVEMLHTYSLIHDDLPCMDDDALRRGKPTNHIIYGEWMATLAGDALQAAAFGTLLDSELPGETVSAMARLLAKAAGIEGICLGQALDMAGEGSRLTLEELTRIHELKTASLLAASAGLGVLAAYGDGCMLEAARKYALALGLAFQIRDDLLDGTAPTEVLGKPTGSDLANRKTTFATLLGTADCGRLIREKTAEATRALGGHFANTEFLEALAIYLEERKC